MSGGRKYKALTIDETKLSQAVSDLPASDAPAVKALVMARQGGYTAAEISEKLGRQRAAAVRQMVCRERKKIAADAHLESKIRMLVRPVLTV